MICLLLVAVLTVLINPRSPVSMEALDEELVVQGSSGGAVRITYSEIQYAELRESLDYGVVVRGEDGKRERSGIWKNEEFGEYQLCVDAKIKSCIVLHMKSGIQVVNIESDQSTASLYDAILKRADLVEQTER